MADLAKMLTRLFGTEKPHTSLFFQNFNYLLIRFDKHF